MVGKAGREVNAILTWIKAHIRDPGTLPPRHPPPVSGTTLMLAAPTDQKRELAAFLFLTVFLAPIFAVLLVAAWGFVVWVFQMVAGPPGAG